ncbi:MAG: endo-1,4-beta-xylanase [Mangrovibacterium sp.]
MKTKIFLSSIIASTMLFASCEDNLMDWSVDDNVPGIAADEIPLELAEKILRYDALKTYSDMRLGVGISASLYGEIEEYTQLANENFDDVTIGYAMKHAAMMKSDGTINFATVDEFLAATKAAGLTLYGHTLVWHQNQNAGYLNGLIASTYEIDESGDSNVLDTSGLKDGTLTGWTKNSAGAGITVEESKGMTGGQALQLVSTASSANYWDLELFTPSITVDPTATYEVSFYIKSDVAGKGRLAFDGLANSYPWVNWDDSGTAEAFTTDATWKHISFTVGAEGTLALAEGSSAFQIKIDLGPLPSVTYLIDVATFSVKDVNASEANNLISNGDFEGGELTGWSGWGNSSTRGVSAEGEGFNSSYAMVLTNPTAASNYNAQQVYTFSEALEKDVEYTCTFMAKADVAAALQVELQNADYSANYYGGLSVGTTWGKITIPMTPTTDDRTKFIFDFGETACTLYIDDIVLTKAGEEGGGGAVVEVPKTDEEKTEIISAAMEDWIKGMMAHYAPDVHAWDVVNEPMQESGAVRDGVTGVVEADMASDEFYWQKYMGKDYAVKAFNWAREYSDANGNTDTKMFVNDYNLETNMTKLDGLIDYVKYIDAQGAHVDGIGTQMHISYNTSKESIATMFEKLAASGKLIKVSELDVRLGTASPTAEQLQEQMLMYQYVFDMYKEKIPEAQQYGITIWGISDNENEHEYWLPEESPNLWTASYARKAAYKGVADGLAGRDVSEDFSGELQY